MWRVLLSVPLLFLASIAHADTVRADDATSTGMQGGSDLTTQNAPIDPRKSPPHAYRGMYNVADFGAKGDGKTDDTEAFQKALNAAYYDGGGIVKVPSGNFLIATHLLIPSNVTLEGVWRKPQWGDYVKGPDDNAISAGTTLLAVEGKGDAEGTPFITLNGPATDIQEHKADSESRLPARGFKGNATLSGVTIYYPDQVNANPPFAYPWTIRGDGDDCGVLNVTIINTYQAVDFGTNPCGRHYVDGLYAYPFKTGIYVNACFDVGRLNNVHLWPFIDPYNDNSPLRKFTMENGTGFIFGRTDGEMVSNSFCIFYNVGMHLIGGPIPNFQPGQPPRIEYFGGAGTFTNVYLDVSPLAVKVDDSMENAGYSFSNCSFMGGIEVGPRNRGPIRFSSCGFWATSDLVNHARLKGMAPVYLESCHFANWDRKNTGAPCIDADARRVLINGCDFLTPSGNLKKIVLGPNVREAIVTSNMMANGVSITNNAPKYADIQIANNVGIEKNACIRHWNLLGPFPNPTVTPSSEDTTPIRAGFTTDYLKDLGGEADAVLRPGESVTYTDENGDTQTVTVRNVSTNDMHRLDVARRLNTNGKTAYAYCEVEVAKAGPVEALFASSDSAKVWVNGKLVHSVYFPEGRDFAPGQDSFTFDATQGRNRILVKTEDTGSLYWDFMLELHDADGNPVMLAGYRTPR